MLLIMLEKVVVASASKNRSFIGIPIAVLLTQNYREDNQVYSIMKIFRVRV